MCLSMFSHLCSQISSDGQLDTDVEKPLAAESRAFGALHHTVFHDSVLSLTTCPCLDILLTQHCYSATCTAIYGKSE